MQGEYNYLHTSPGNNDECYSERYAVEPLLEFMERFSGKLIWCPFDKEDSEFVRVFSDNGFDVVYSHIDRGQDFYHYEPPKWDLMISNPPFTGKRKIFERALSFNKPFALIMTLAWLNDSAPAQVFKYKDLQLLMFERRMSFKGQGNKINFAAAYYCWDFLPQQIIIRNFEKRNQLKLAL